MPARTPNISAWVSRWHVVLVLAACLLVFWIGLGDRPFAASEGHRVVPGWTMLESGDWWHLDMFGQTYVRKPPGMPWAIAGLSSIFGQTEFGARSASALASTLAALLAMVFGARWFGARFGVVCGLMQATLPLLWLPGRTAEIEALHNLGVQMASLAMMDLVLSGTAAGAWLRGLGAAPSADDDPMRIGPAGGSDADGLRPAALRLVMMMLGAAGIVVAGLAKGPAGAPVLIGTLIGGALAMRSFRAPARVLIVLAMAIGGGVLWVFARKILAANNDPGAIRQGSDDFLWTQGVGKVLLMGPTAFVSAMPAALAFVFVWGGNARREAGLSGSGATRRAYGVARLLAYTWAATMVVMTVMGVGNARYAMPAAFVFPMLCGYVVRGVWGAHASFGKSRREWARALTFKNPTSWVVVLCVAAVLGGRFAARRAQSDDPREAARVIAEAFGSAGAGEVWADDLIEARPDVLLYAERGTQGAMNVLWKKSEMVQTRLPPTGALIVLRTDKESGERRRYGEAIADGKLILVREGRLGKYGFEVYRVR